MSASSFGSPSPDLRPSGQRDAQKQNMTILLALLGLVVVGNLAYFLIKKPVSQAAVAAVVEEKNEKYAALDSVFAAAKTELDSLRRLKPELENRLAEREAELEAKRNEIANFIRSGGSEREAERRIAQLRAENQTALAQIEQLKTEVTGLRERVVFVEKERDEATAQLVAATEKTAAAEAASLQVLEEKRRADAERSALAERMEASAVLSVGAVEAQPVMVSVRDPNKTKPTSSAKKTDRIDIRFSVNPNELVKSGPQTFFIQIQRGGDAGETLSGPTSGTEKNFLYSAKTVVEYAQGPVQGVLQFAEPSGFEKGEYAINVFHKGRKVGSGAFSLKK